MKINKEFTQGWMKYSPKPKYTVPKKNCTGKHIMVHQGTYHGTWYYKCKNCDAVEVY